MYWYVKSCITEFLASLAVCTLIFDLPPARQFGGLCTPPFVCLDRQVKAGCRFEDFFELIAIDACKRLDLFEIQAPDLAERHAVGVGRIKCNFDVVGFAAALKTKAYSAFFVVDELCYPDHSVQPAVASHLCDDRFCNLPCHVVVPPWFCASAVLPSVIIITYGPKGAQRLIRWKHAPHGASRVGMCMCMCVPMGVGVGRHMHMRTHMKKGRSTPAVGN